MSLLIRRMERERVQTKGEAVELSRREIQCLPSNCDFVGVPSSLMFLIVVKIEGFCLSIGMPGWIPACTSKMSLLRKRKKEVQVSLFGKAEREEALVTFLKNLSEYLMLPVLERYSS